MNEALDLLREFLKGIEQEPGLTLKTQKVYNKELEEIDLVLCKITEVIDSKPRIK
jgi:hypothetical protein